APQGNDPLLAGHFDLAGVDAGIFPQMVTHLVQYPFVGPLIILGAAAPEIGPRVLPGRLPAPFRRWAEAVVFLPAIDVPVLEVAPAIAVTVRQVRRETILVAPV